MPFHIESCGLPFPSPMHESEKWKWSHSVVSNPQRPHGLPHTRLFPIHHLLELAQTQVHWVDDAIQPSHPLSTPSPPAFNLFQIRVFSSESALCIRWPKYWSFSISPSNEFSGLISFRIDWFDLHAVQGTLKNLLQYHSSKVSIFPCSALFPLLLLLLLSRFSRVRLCATPETAAHQAPPSLGFSRQEHWSGLPFSSPDLPLALYYLK